MPRIAAGARRAGTFGIAPSRANCGRAPTTPNARKISNYRAIGERPVLRGEALDGSPVRASFPARGVAGTITPSGFAQPTRARARLPWLGFRRLRFRA